MRYAIVTLGRSDTADTLRRYLPDNYKVEREDVEFDNFGLEQVLICGEDSHGWTLDGYVIPRLASGLIGCREVWPCAYCGGHGGHQQVVYWDRSDPNACYPDFEECGYCDGLGFFLERMNAAHIEAIVEAEARDLERYEREMDEYERSSK